MRLLLVLVFLSAYSFTASAKAVGTVSGGQTIFFPSWLKDSFLEIAEDSADAAAENKHVILFFHLDGCPYCTVMMKESFAEAPFADYLRDNFSVIELNIKGDREVAFDENNSMSEKELSQKLNVFSTPTILFLDASGKAVLRFNGYRTANDFKLALDFVKHKKYQTVSFVDYLNAQELKGTYSFLVHESFIETDNLSALPKDKTVAIIFEDKNCELCVDFHQRILTQPETKKILKKMSVIRLDARSDKKLIGFDGKETSPQELAKALAMSYRPGIVFFYDQKEVARIGGMLRTFHATMMLKYAAEQQFKEYESWLDFAKIEEGNILKSGQNIDIWE